VINRVAVQPKSRACLKHPPDALPWRRRELRVGGEPGGSYALHVFVAMPYGTKEGKNFNKVYTDYIKPALEGRKL